MTSADVVFVLGGPGAGKGTQCANIVKNFDFVHLSAGDLLRDERKKGGNVGMLIDTYIKEGKIVPVEITIGLIKSAMEANVKAGRKRFLVDGFPRNQNNLEGWSKLMNDYANVHFVLFLDCPEDVMEKRLLNRGEGRADDNIQSIKKRFKTYMEETKPIIDIFNLLGKVRKVVSNKGPQEVYAEVEKVFLPVFGSFKLKAAAAPAVPAPASQPAVPTPAPAAPAPAAPAPPAPAAAVPPPPATGEEDGPDDPADVKKDFSLCVADMLRELNLDVESGEEKKTAKARFWDLSQESQKVLVEHAVRIAVFNPQPTDPGVKSVNFKVSSQGIFSLSGGYTVTADVVNSDGTSVHHSCRVNSFGVLEWWETPLHPQKRHLIPAQAKEEAECSIM